MMRKNLLHSWPLATVFLVSVLARAASAQEGGNPPVPPPAPGVPGMIGDAAATPAAPDATVPQPGKEGDVNKAWVGDVFRSRVAEDKPIEKKKNIFLRWKEFIDSELDRIGELDPYGVTSQLPAGYLAAKWDWGMLKAKRRYNDKRDLGPVMQPLEFSNGNTKLLSVDLGLSGEGGGHTFQFSYGLTGRLDYYIEFPFQYQTVSFNPVARTIDDQGNTIDASLAGMLGISDTKLFTGRDFLTQLIPMTGRPIPALKYKGKWALGDINTGFSWNPYRSPRMSIGLTGRVFFPSGHVADPNNSLTYGTGPELDIGRGGWAVGFTQGYDVRLFKYKYWIDIIASSEFTASYSFPQQRRYPTNFTKPDPRIAALDPAGTLFPDCSHLGKNGNPTHFTYRPGFGVDWNAQLNVSIALLSLGFGYGVSYSQMPEIEGDRNFITMIKGLELLGQQATHAIETSVGISLLPLYIPLQIAFKYRKAVDGYNAIVMDDFYQLTLKTYIPIWPH